MLTLPFDQIVHIQASLAFANLAASKEKRPRTRRGAGRRTSQSTIDNTTPRRVPIGTPSRPAPNTPFSHIQIVPKASPEHSIIQETSPQPMFRKPSLTHDAEAVIASSNVLETGRSTDSLANNTQGTTFAATARAAELRAARARKQLKENENQSKPGTSAVPHEVMTFTKSRSKGGKTWKTLNLDDLPEVSDPESQNNGYSSRRDQTNQIAAGYDSEHEDTRDTNTTKVPHYLSILKPKDKVILSGTQSGLSPDSKKLVQLVENYDVSQWDPELPSKEKVLQGSCTDESSNHDNSHLENSNQRKRTVSITPALYPVPVLASSSDQIQKAAEYLRQKQESQIRELEAELQSQAMHHQAMNQPKAFHATVDLVSELHHSHSNSCLLAGSVAADKDDDPFAASPPPISPPSMTRYQSSTNVAMGPPPLPYNLIGQAPRQFVPHQYPAVKGTSNNVASRPTLERTLTGSSAISQYQGYYPPGLHGHRQTTTDLAQPPQTPYRKLSAEEKKGMLLQQLNAVVDESNSSGTLPKSGRTVLHDPFAYDQYQPSVPVQAIAMGSPDIDLFTTSDPLPWKDRPVDVVATSSMANVEYMAIGNKQMTPIGTRPLRGGLPSGQTMQNSAKAALKEAEYWWSDDRRVDGIAKRQIEDFMEHTKAGNRKDKVPDITNRFSNLSGAWSDSSQYTASPDALSGRAVGDHLLVPVLANLKSYLTPGGYFNKHGHVPEWCIDQGAGGHTSFFGEDWGAPPPRVGRDPRYQPVLHEGTRSVYENFGGRWGSDGYARRYR
ncbi:hypothetical protein MMC18_003852 [Xylographa bjoerkii]|nr:hypothetical protein [Xylographa bjoerkii]